MSSGKRNHGDGASLYGPFEQQYKDDGDKSGTVTITLADGNVHRIRLTGNITSFTVNGATSGKACSLTLIMVQDGTGSRTMAWMSGAKWEGGVAAVLSTAASAVDVLTFITVDGGTTWYGFLAGKGLS